MQAQHHNIPFPISLWEKTADSMFSNISSNVMVVIKQVTSTLQVMKQWNLYFFFLMVFTGQNSVNSFLTLFRMEGRESGKRSLLVFLNTFWILVLNFLPYWRKILGPYLAPVSNYWTWTKTSPQKIGFSDRIRIKFELW